MPTTTLSYITAEDGESDTIDLSQQLNIVTDVVYINDIDIRWRGNETRRENTFTETATNVNTDTSTGEKTTNTITDTDYYWDYEKNYNTDSFTATVEDSKTVTRENTGSINTQIPASPGSEYTLTEASVRFSVDNNDDEDVIMRITVGGRQVYSNSIPKGGSTAGFVRVTYTASPSDSVKIDFTGGASDTYEVDTVELTAEATFEKPAETNTGRATATYPPVPDGYQFHRHEFDGTQFEDRYIYDNRVGTTVDSRAVADEDGQTVELQLATVGKKRESRTTTRTVTNFDNPPAQTTFPPVPDGYNFNKHEVRGDTNNRYIYNNRVGETVQSNRPQSDGETVTIDAVTYGTRTQTNVSVDQTQYAELIGDITASVTTTLNDNETTSTRNVDTHQSGVTSELEANYNIGNSEYVDYQLTLDWQYPYALPQHGSLALKEDGQWYLIAIADPNSPALKHNHIRLYDDQTGTWGAIDVAPVDAPRTIESYRFYDSQTDQWFAPRYYDVRQT